FLDDLLEDAFKPPRPTADAAPAFSWQMMAFVEEHLHEIAAVEQGRQVRLDQKRQALPRCSAASCDRLGGFVGGKIVVEARLPDAQHVGNILGGSAVKAALGEDARGRIDDLRRAATLVRAAAGRGKSQNVHPDYSLIACWRCSQTSAWRQSPSRPLCSGMAAI